MKKMARQLKSDLLNLQQVFTKTHDRFRIVRASVDEMLCRFCMQNKSFYDIQANIPVSVHVFIYLKLKDAATFYFNQILILL